MITTLLIDADTIVYKAAFVAAGPGAGKLAAGMVEKIVRRMNADAVLLAKSKKYDNGQYFRHRYYPQYKAGRAEPPAFIPDAWAGLKDAKFPIREIPGLEADDVLGILATTNRFPKAGRRVIVSYDGDLLTVPAEHFNPDKGVLLPIGEAEAEARHLMFTLTGKGSGKRCDFPGCRGIGEDKAYKIAGPLAYAANPHETWQRVVKAFTERGQTEADALNMARVARILRACDFDFDDKSAIPWEPPGTAYTVFPVAPPTESVPAVPAVAAEPVPASLFGGDEAGGFTQ